MATIYVCRKCKHSKELQRALERGTDATVKLVGCQDICKQPVAGTRIDGCLQWFGGLDQGKRQRGLIELVSDPRPTEIPKALVKARSPKRAGKNPR
jgi:hypothetical protein